MLSLVTECYPPRPPYPSRIFVPAPDPEDRCWADSFIPHPPRDPQGDAVLHGVPRSRDIDLQDYSEKPRNDERDWVRVWSYGGFLLLKRNRQNPRAARGNVSVPLLRLIAWCLCDDPYYRPRLQQLQEEIRRGANANRRIDRLEGTGRTGPRPRNTTDDALIDWVRLVFDQPEQYWR
jgi:hypothetical protein